MDYMEVLIREVCSTVLTKINYNFVSYRYLVSMGCIKPLCDLLTVQDSRMIIVTLEGLENILRVGNKDVVSGVNSFSVLIEEAYGMLIL